MKETGKRLMAAFIIWTLMVWKVDEQPIGANGTNIGFATLNGWFHKLTGVHMTLYIITDWLGLFPIFVGMIFGGVCAVGNKRSFAAELLI